MKKFDIGIITFLAFSFLGLNNAYAQEEKPSNSLTKFLKEIKYTSRLGIEYNDNIFLTENKEDADVAQIFTQALEYQRAKDPHYFEWSYVGNYQYFDSESIDILAHTASALYSYRPYDGFSFGLGHRFNWLEDSRITTAIGDRLLALGYYQYAPNAQVKFEINPDLSLVADLTYQRLDVRSPSNDDFLDHERWVSTTQLDYYLTQEKDWVGSAGFQHDQITFPQIFEKDAKRYRPYIGLTKKFPGLMNLSSEVGFDNIDFGDHTDDNNVDAKFSLETVFSIYTKLALSYVHNRRNPSLRSEYAQYGSKIGALNLNHTLNPKTSLSCVYSFEQQDFHSTDALLGAPNLDRQTKIQNLGLGVNRKLNNWLTLGVNYSYTKRDTDFLLEGYTANRYTMNLTAKY